MKNKTFKIISILSAMPYLAVFIIPAFLSFRVLFQYDFSSTFSIYFPVTLCVLGAHFPVIPLSVGFHAGIVINLMLKKLNISEKTVKILSVVSAVIIFSLFTAALVKYFSHIDFV